MKAPNLSNRKKFLASCLASVFLSFVASVVMTVAYDWRGIARHWEDIILPDRGQLRFALLMAIVLVTWTSAKNYGLRLKHFVFPGFMAIWAVQIVLYPEIPAGYRRPYAGFFYVSSIPVQTFLRTLQMFLVQAVVLLAMWASAKVLARFFSAAETNCADEHSEKNVANEGSVGTRAANEGSIGTRVANEGSIGTNLGKHLASFATNAILAFVVSVVMTLASDGRSAGLGAPNQLYLALLVIIALATWTTVRSCGLKFSHFAFSGFLAMWVVPLLLRPSIPGGFAQATLSGSVMQLIPSIPTQAFLRALLVLVLQTLVLHAMDRRKLRDDWLQLYMWWTRIPGTAEKAGSGSEAATAKETGSPAESGREKS